jgi:hypothetical protein
VKFAVIARFDAVNSWLPGLETVTGGEAPSLAPSVQSLDGSQAEVPSPGGQVVRGGRVRGRERPLFAFSVWKKLEEGGVRVRIDGGKVEYAGAGADPRT